jgi:PAS domain S-box-containing protein
MLTLREVGERTATARDVKGFWQQVLLALTENEMDTPFLLLYSVSDENDSDSSSLYSNSLIGSKHCYLEGSLGVPCGHVAAPDHFDLREGHEGFGPVLREVMKTDKPVVVSIGSGDLPSKMMEGLEWRGFGDACREVVVCPIHPTTGESILGFLIMGINPRRPYDDDYNLFIQLLSRQLATSLASVVLFEEEIRRGQKAAKLAAEDRFHLSEQLAARTQEALDSETRFTRMTEYSPAGLFIADHAGRITYCNDTWYEISRVPKEPEKTDKWMEYVREEDQKLIQEQWKQLVDNADAINIEFRFKTPWSDRSGNEGDTWVLFCAFPEKYEDGMLKSVFGSITNISSQKWAEGFQKRKMEEAVELKRQQENFIDMTSHEMRNPLSAILQCADEISTILGEFKTSGAREIPPRIVTDSIDAAQTIALCGQHQKRIVDDVLTLSKIDSAMLMVCA